MGSAGRLSDGQTLLLPKGTRLVHIGPHKTGTTGLQAAFHAARRTLARQGVDYASRNRQSMQAARALVGRASPYAEGRVPDESHWTSVVRRIERSTADRVVLSAETFADADPAVVRRLVGDLDPSRVHIVATLRSLARILPSQWQQYVQNGVAPGFDDWLRAVLDGTPGVTPTFWHRHRHDQLLARWAEVVGPERVTAVVVDDSDHEAVLRTFERLLGLTDGTLHPSMDLANRSLNRAEVELVRAMHAAMAELGIPKGLRLNLVFHGAAANQKLRRPAPDEPRIEAPGWALERLAPLTREIVAGIAATQVRVVGDLETLVVNSAGGGAVAGVPSAASTASAAGVASAASTASAAGAWPTIAARALIGVLVQTGLTRTRSWSRIPELGAWSTSRLTSLLAGRTRSALGPDSLTVRTARKIVRSRRRSSSRHRARSVRSGQP